MALELIYTSAPRGLRIGSSGFCTVACTRGLPANYVELLESLSGYEGVFPPNHASAHLNPTAFSHYRFVIAGKTISVVSRVAPAGVDYTKRNNKIAHHLVVDPGERPIGGPAWLLQQPGVVMDRWDGTPMYVETPRKLPVGDSQPAPCVTWERLTGDAGWAGVLAQAYLDNPREPAFLVFTPGTPVLDLIAEALALVPPAQRWDVTFNTYATGLPINSSCSWRCCLPDSPQLRQARRQPDAVLLNLAAGAEQPPAAQRRLAAGSHLIDCARTGERPDPSALAARLAPVSGASGAPGMPTQPQRPIPRERAYGADAPRPPVLVEREVHVKSRWGGLILIALAVLLALSLLFNVLLLARARGPAALQAKGASSQEAAGAAAPADQTQEGGPPVGDEDEETNSSPPLEPPKEKEEQTATETSGGKEESTQGQEDALRAADMSENDEEQGDDEEKEPDGKEDSGVGAAKDPEVSPNEEAAASPLVYVREHLTFDDQSPCTIPVPGVSKEWRVENIDWWGERPRIALKERSPGDGRPEERETALVGNDLMGQREIDYAILRIEGEGKLVVTRGTWGKVTDKQFADIERIAVMVLKKEGASERIILLLRQEADIPIPLPKTGKDGKTFRGPIRCFEALKTLEQRNRIKRRWLSSPSDSWDKHTVDIPDDSEGDQMTVELSFFELPEKTSRRPRDLKLLLYIQADDSHEGNETEQPFVSFQLKPRYDEKIDH